MNTSVASILLEIDAEAAFELFTRDVDIWWRRGPAFRVIRRGEEGRLHFEPGVGGRFVQVFDEASDDVWEFGRILAWEPGVRLLFEYRIPNFTDGEVTEVEVTFTTESVGTRVQVVHRGWDRVPPNHRSRHGLAPEEFAMEKGAWWLDLLRAYRRRTT